MASYPRPEICFVLFFSFPPSVPNSTDKLSGHDSSRTQQTPSNCPHERERVPDLSPPAASLSQRTPPPPNPEGHTHCFGVELVPRLRQHFIHPRLVHESDEAETPAPRSEGEADGYKDSEWPAAAGGASLVAGEVSGTHLDLLVRGSRITRHSFTSPNWPKYSRSPSVTTHSPSDQPRPGALPPPPSSFAPGDPGAAPPPPRRAARARSPRPPPPTPALTRGGGGSRGAFLAPTGGLGKARARAGLEWGTAPVGFPPLREQPQQKFEPQVRAELELPLAGPGGPARPPMPLEPPPHTHTTAPQPAPGRAHSPSVLRSRGPRGGARKRARGRPGSAGRGAGQGRPGLGRRKGCRVTVRGPAGDPRAGSPCVVCQLSPPMNILLREEQRHKGPA